MTLSETDLPLRDALTALGQLDKDIARAIHAYGMPKDRSMEEGYSSLARIILGQQISRAVATSLWQKLTAKGWTDSPQLAGKTPEQLFELGISRRKAEYLIDLAKAVEDNRLDLPALKQKSGDEVQRILVDIRGIGAWTADNYRLFCLLDFDAWPGNDLALQEGMKRLKGLSLRPNLKEMDRLAANWQPYRGAGALMLWHIYAIEVRQATPSDI